MDTSEFAHQIFCSVDWETKLKDFIDSINCSDGIIWHKKREHKKINEELATLGYYVKYRFNGADNITFRLNEKQDKADGWIYNNGTQIESVQIAIAYYGKEEANIDRRTMNDENFFEFGWVGERIDFLKRRVEERIRKKSTMKYKDIDTLLIGVRDQFVQRLNSEYSVQKKDIVKCIEALIERSKFKRAAIVDTDYVFKGNLLVVANEQG